MANVFKNHTGNAVGTTATTVYTVPASTVAVVIGLNVSNILTSSITVDVALAGTYVVKGAPIPAGAALSVLDGKIIMEAGEALQVTSSAASSADVILSVLEQS